MTITANGATGKVQRIADFTTKGGHSARFAVRADTSDWDTVNSVVTHDEYGFAEKVWSGIALDVGAHIGAATIALALDNPSLHVIAIEALPENVEMIRRNVRLNDLDIRVTVNEGAADSGTWPVSIAYGATDTELASNHRFIGGGIWHGTNAPTIEVRPVSLRSLVVVHGPIALVKIDCEGCEWSFLNDPMLSAVGEFRGEYHPRGGNGPARLRELLEPTHVVTLDDAEPFGLFRAVRR